METTLDKQDFWRQVLESVRSKVSYPDFITWFKNTTLLESSDGVLKVGVSMPIAAKWLRDRFHQQILESVKALNPSFQEVSYELDTKLAAGDDPRLPSPELFLKDTHRVKTRKQPKIAEFKTEHGLSSKILDERYTLENFVVGPDNRLAHAACSAVSVEPGRRYNPLFIYGSVGLGKTHLLQATGNAFMRRNSNSLVIYVPAETFGNDYVQAIKNRKIDQFNNRYRKVDMLIIDDIQFFAGKNGMQEAFFHVFNTLYDSQKQVIISSDRPPSELDNIDQRLTSRFSMGMVADIQIPDFETRLAILQEKVAFHRVLIENKILEFIAEHVTSSVRELEGVLMQAIAEAELEEATPTLASVSRVLRKLNRNFEVADELQHASPGHAAKSHDDVVAIVAKHYGVTADDLYGSKRKQELVFPRQVAMHLIKMEFSHSLDHIGKTFGGRNHTTVLHAINSIKARIQHDRNLARDINALRKQLGFRH
jgi:chromosomal replication initiator protein